MLTVAAISRRDTTNTGDLVCSPCDYFDYGARHHDIKKALPIADAYIFGGGAMFPKTIRTGVAGVKIGWGLGQSNPNLKTTKQQAPVDFALFGSRDVGLKGAEWVPCASCMSPLFDEEYTIRHGAVAYFNLCPPSSVDRAVEGSKVEGLSIKYNRGSFEDAIRFIGSGNICVTNSYHGAYWATLLGRAAIIVSPYSSKFYCYEHQPVVVESGSWRAAKPVVFHDALEECRDANIAFDMKVRSRIC